MQTPVPEKNPSHQRIILIGDVVGKPGMKIVVDSIPALRSVVGCDFIVVNAENAADGAGLTVKQYERLIQSGVDAITLGDHCYKKKEISTVLCSAANIVKPANFPSSAPGKEFCVVKSKANVELAVVSVLGRVFMRPVDCPFRALDRVLTEIPDRVRIRLCDIHAEATSDKQSMGYYLDGRISAVLGTHTHVATADEQILPKGTAFQCDVGMTGAYRSILGREIEPVLNTTLSFDPNTFHVAVDDVRLSGTWFDVDPATGISVRIGRLQWKQDEVDRGSK